MHKLSSIVFGFDSELINLFQGDRIPLSKYNPFYTHLRNQVLIQKIHHYFYRKLRKRAVCYYKIRIFLYEICDQTKVFQPK
jgi:hypothetical protein